MSGTTPSVEPAPKLRPPETLGERDIGAFLTELAFRRGEPLARQALLFLYREFLHQDLGPIPANNAPRLHLRGPTRSLAHCDPRPGPARSLAVPSRNLVATSVSTCLGSARDRLQSSRPVTTLANV